LHVIQNLVQPRSGGKGGRKKSRRSGSFTNSRSRPGGVAKKEKKGREKKKRNKKPVIFHTIHRHSSAEKGNFPFGASCWEKERGEGGRKKEEGR